MQYSLSLYEHMMIFGMKRHYNQVECQPVKQLLIPQFSRISSVDEKTSFCDNEEPPFTCIVEMFVKNPASE